MAIVYSIINCITDDIREEWNGLLDRINNPEVFYTYEWNSTYASHFLDMKRVCVVTGRDSDRLICIFPFTIKDCTINFITDELADYNTIYVDRDYNKYEIISKAIEFLLKERDIKKFCLTNMPSSDELFLLEDILRRNGFNAYLEESVICPFYDRNTDRDKASKKQLKDIERREKRLSEEHTVSYEKIKIITDDVWDFIRINREKRHGDNALNRKGTKEFYQELSKISESLTIDKLTLDNKMVAVHLGFSYRNKDYYYIPVFSQEYMKQGIGMILLKHMIDNSHGSVFDFLKGNEQYKFKWTDSSIMNFHLLAYRADKSGLIQNTIMRIKNNRFVRSILGR